MHDTGISKLPQCHGKMREHFSTSAAVSGSIKFVSEKTGIVHLHGIIKYRSIYLAVGTLKYTVSTGNSI